MMMRSFKSVTRDEVVLNVAVLNVDEVVGRRVICPACGCFEFQNWPEGWDGHAGFRCEGLSVNSPDDRKLEFRKKLKHLFR